MKALLHLDMDNLGPMDVFVLLKANNVTTNFKVASDDILAYIEEHISELNERLNALGYSVTSTVTSDKEKIFFCKICNGGGISIGWNKNVSALMWERKPWLKKRKKRKQAIAIQYNPDEVAPKILASGTGIIADKIIEKAKSSDVPLYEDNKLANTLSKLDIGEYIPPELYSIVAEILVFVDNLDKIKGKIYDRK